MKKGLISCRLAIALGVSNLATLLMLARIATRLSLDCCYVAASRHVRFTSLFLRKKRLSLLDVIVDKSSSLSKSVNHVTTVSLVGLTNRLRW